MENIILLTKNYLNPDEILKKLNQKYSCVKTDDDIIFVKTNDDALFLYFDGIINNEPRDLDETLQMYDNVVLPYDKPFVCEIEFYDIELLKSVLKLMDLCDTYIDNNHGLIVSISSFLSKLDPLEEGKDQDNTIVVL